MGERHPRAGLGHHGAERQSAGHYRRAWHRRCSSATSTSTTNRRAAAASRPECGSIPARPSVSRASTSPWATRTPTITSGPTATRSSPGRSSTRACQPGEGRECRLSPRQRQQHRRRDQHQRNDPLPRRRGALPLHHCAARKAAGPTTAAPARPTTTATARTLSPAIGTWTWRINSASRKPSPTTSPTPVDADESDRRPGVSAFLVHDQFNTQNSFNGGDLGMKFEFQRNRWSLDLFPALPWAPRTRWSISAARRGPPIRRDGIDDARRSTTQPSNGGLLAQPTQHRPLRAGQLRRGARTRFELGFQFTRHTRVVVGYNGLYWSRVARAGEQIDRTVNSTLLPDPRGVTPAGDLTHPQFTFQQTGFWAQGINVGVDCRW